MRKIGIFIGLAVLSGVVAAVGCGNGGTSTTSGGGGSTATSTHASTTTTTTTTTTSSHSSTSTTTTTGTGGKGAGGMGVGGGFGGGFGGGAGGTLPDPWECTVPSTSPSAGSCVTVLNADAGTGFDCNPVTNAPCAATEQCDTNFDNSGNLVGFVCWPSDEVAVCMACDPSNGMACGASLTCFTYDGAGDSACTRYCCTDADCGAGKCTTMNGGTAIFDPISTTLGVCSIM